MSAVARTEQPPLKAWMRRFLKPEAFTGYAFISPALFLMLVLLAYPFCLAVSISLSDRVLGEPGKFIGIGNFISLL
ncbi:MAG: sugar ABC transporter permease, partial [Anaerolineae bacterium]|nr:sugar ABC transporter permease [Anaerolineae bacterium]NIN95523.1 sugar ABC transporter permease [Anaerolineae bacterium]